MFLDEVHEAFHGFVAPSVEPAIAELRRMRPGSRRVVVFQAVQFRVGLVFLPHVAAQHGVEESGLRAEARLLAHLDGLVDGGVIGHAVEPEDLVEAEAQQILQEFQQPFSSKWW